MTLLPSAGTVSDDGRMRVELAPLRAVAPVPSPSAKPFQSHTAISVPHRRKQFFSVGGMTCAACSNTIERALMSVEGVHSARISLLTERAEVVYDESKLSEKDIISEIEDVGFDASVSDSVSKGKISLLTRTVLSSELRAVVSRALLEHAGVIAVHVKSAPRRSGRDDENEGYDVIEIEFDAEQHRNTGPGGEKPVVWQGSSPPPSNPSPSVASTSPSSSSSPVAPSPVPSSSATPSASISPLSDASSSRFSIRACMATLRLLTIPIHSVRNDGDLESRRQEMAKRRADETNEWKSAFIQSLFFTVPIALLCWLGPLIPPMKSWLMQPFHRSLSREAFILWILVTPVQFGFGLRFYRNSYKALRHGSANMDVLVTLGSSSAYFYSLIVCFMCLYNDHYNGYGQ